MIFHDATDEKASPFRLLILGGHCERSEAIRRPTHHAILLPKYDQQ
jgi:hypothetical protein